MNTNIQMMGAGEQEWLRTLLTDREQTVERVLTAIEPISKVSSGLDGGYLERLFAHTSKALKSSLGRQIVDLNPLESATIQQLTSYLVILAHNARLTDRSSSEKNSCEGDCERQHLWCIDHTPNALCRLELIACKNACYGPTTQGAWLYEDHHFGGQTVVLGPGEYPDLGIYNFDKKLTSLRSNGFAVALFSEKHFGGQSETFRGDVHNVDVVGRIGHDYASSCKVFPG